MAGCENRPRFLSRINLFFFLCKVTRLHFGEHSYIGSSESWWLAEIGWLVRWLGCSHNTDWLRLENITLRWLSRWIYKFGIYIIDDVLDVNLQKCRIASLLPDCKANTQKPSQNLKWYTLHEKKGHFFNTWSSELEVQDTGWFIYLKTFQSDQRYTLVPSLRGIGFCCQWKACQHCYPNSLICRIECHDIWGAAGYLIKIPSQR